MVILDSDYAIYHEVTNGPFRIRDSLNAPWAPAEDQNPKDQKDFVLKILKLDKIIS